MGKKKHYGNIHHMKHAKIEKNEIKNNYSVKTELFIRYICFKE